MIDIVLATYNGAKFLKEQITSIQNCEGYNELIERFIIIDDGSTDDTLKIIEKLKKPIIK
ncbi:glycosyltransferase [Psychromonas sp. KJ10-10]|uniref:glycosyltransferase n=1 Tax=Psychromonas sp. KJ10-10 TaxID=3391823 RepID=UPI0039B650D1